MNLNNVMVEAILKLDCEMRIVITYLITLHGVVSRWFEFGQLHEQLLQ